jgi:hypothetical protein
MTDKLTSGQTRNFRILAHCPATGEQVWGDKLTHFSVPGAKAAWWYCSECEGWHILVYMENGESVEDSRGGTFSQVNLRPVPVSQ